MQDLGTLPGDVNSAGLGINDRGDVVGASIDGPLATGNPRPFIWQNGRMSDLNALIPADSPLYLLGVFWINDAGQIAVLGLDVNTFEIHAFLASPNAGNGGLAVRDSTRPGALPVNVRKVLRR
jgi:probable HAF family extracellular repeat protein